MAWIELHQSLRDHPKLLRLASAVGSSDPDLVRAKLENLWLWCLDYAESGALRCLSAHEIAIASRWPGDEAVWQRSLIECGWLDKRDGGAGGYTLHVHDWQEFAGRLIDRRNEKRNATRERVTRYRMTRVTPCNAPTVPYPTVPNLTNQREEGTPPTPSFSLSENSDQESQDLREELKEALAQPVSLNPGDEVIRQLMQKARLAKCPSKPDTIRRHLEALVGRFGAKSIEEYLCAQETLGKTVNDWQEDLRKNGYRQPEDPKKQTATQYWRERHDLEEFIASGRCDPERETRRFEDGWKLKFKAQEMTWPPAKSNGKH